MTKTETPQRTYTPRAYAICLAHYACGPLMYPAREFMVWRAIRYREYLALFPEHGWNGSKDEVDTLRDDVAQAFDTWLEKNFPRNGFHLA